MLSKREAAELNAVKGWSIICATDDLNKQNCPFFNDCRHVGRGSDSQCKEFSIQWLKDNPEGNEWNELKLTNLPDMTKRYEYQKGFGESVDFRFEIFEMDNEDAVCELFNGNRVLYRVSLPVQEDPTHEEIMTKWWKLDGRTWQKIQQYVDGQYFPSTNKCTWLSKEAFSDRESADCPPENKS